MHRCKLSILRATSPNARCDHECWLYVVLPESLQSVPEWLYTVLAALLDKGKPLMTKASLHLQSTLCFP